MTALQEADVSRLALLFERHHRALFNFFLRLTCERQASEDLVQDVFLRILKYHATYRPGRSTGRGSARPTRVSGPTQAGDAGGAARRTRSGPAVPRARRERDATPGLEIEEEHNLMVIKTGWPNNHAMRLSIQVPARTSLDLSVVNDGNIIVDGVDGDIVANNVNGAVTLTSVSGAVVAHALNDDVKATFTRYSGKPMSFSSLNGTLDVTLPADTKATLKLQSDNGEVYSDFPVDRLAPSLNQTVQDDRSKGGKYRLKIEKAMTGRINGGGPEITFKTFNGDIRLRRGGGAGSAR